MTTPELFTALAVAAWVAVGAVAGGRRTMRRKALSFVIACLAAILASLAVVMALLPPFRESSRQAFLATQIIGLAVAVTYPLLFLPVFVVLSRRARRLRRTSAALVGAVLSLVTFLWTAWTLEGLEYGLWSLVGDPGNWAWLAALATGGAMFGLVWRSRWTGARPRAAR